MRCNAFVPTVNLKGWGKHPWAQPLRGYGVIKPANTTKRELAKTWKIKASQIKVCGGKIIARVSATEEPYWGGSMAKLNVDYECMECHCTYYPQLPAEDSLSNWLTEKIEWE